MKYTHKTRDGKLARILATDMISSHPVVVAIQRPDGREVLQLYTSTLKFCLDGEDCDMDLVEYNPWEDVKVDTKIQVRDEVGGGWCKRYFSHYADGKVHAFADGATSWSCDDVRDTVSWLQAKLAE